MAHVFNDSPIPDTATYEQSRRLALEIGCTHEIVSRASRGRKSMRLANHFGRFVVDQGFVEAFYLGFFDDVHDFRGKYPAGGREWHPDFLPQTGDIDSIVPLAKSRKDPR